MSSIHSLVFSQQGKELIERLCILPTNACLHLLYKTNFVRTLFLLIKQSADPYKEIKIVLDKMDDSLKPDEGFYYTEIIMALIVAMEKAKVPLYKKIVKVIQSSKGNSMGRLRAFCNNFEKKVGSDASN